MKKVTVRAPVRADLAGGTLDLWPLYLFHPGAVTVNVGISVMTHCRITPSRGKAIWLRSLDTGKEDRFADANALLKTKKYKHALAGYLCRFFLKDAGNLSGFTLETHCESPAGAGISGSSALLIDTTP